MGFGEGGVVPGEMPVLDVGAEFRLLRDAVLSFAQREERDFSPAEIGEQIVHLSHSRDILSRELAKLTGVFSRTDEAENQGSQCATDWIRHQAKMSVADALELQVVGKHLDQTSLASAALDEGTIGFGHLVHLARNAAFSARSGAFDEAPLLPSAQAESVSRFRHTCLHARHAQDPEQHLANEVSAVECRELTINPLDDGTTWINVHLDNAAAAITQAVLESGAKRLGSDDHRPRDRRMADAFVELTQAPLTIWDGQEAAGQKVQINVTCTAETLLNLRGAAAGELEYGQPIPAATVGRLACNATITRILLDERDVPIAVGHTRRMPTRRERRGVNVRDGHCRWPGCERPPSQCTAHHVDWYSRSHMTKLDRLILLCAHHHWRVHEGGWQLAITADGDLVVAPPHMANLARGPAELVAA